MGKKRHKPNKEYESTTRSKTGSGDWWDPRVGEKEMFRVLPAWDERGIRVLRRVLHYGFEVDGRNRAFPCLEDNEPWLPSSPCPICHVVRQMSLGDKDERDAASDMEASSAKFLVQGVDVNHPERGVQKWASPLSFGKYFLSLSDDDDIDDVTDPDDGFDFIVEKSGKGRGTKYDYRLRPKSTPVNYPEWEDNLSDLIKTMDILSPDELIEIVEENYGNVFDIKKYLKDFEVGKFSTQSEKKTSGSEYTQDDIKGMKKRKLLKLVADNELDIEDDDWETIDELKEAVIDELDIDIPF